MRARVLFAVVVTIAGCVFGPTSAFGVTWNATSGYWDVADNWGGVVPTSSDSIVVANGGNIDLNGARQSIVDVGASGAGFIGNFSNGTLSSSGTIYAQSGNVDATLDGSAGLVKSGSAAVALNRLNTYAGVTTISAGTLRVGDGTTAASLGGGSISLASGATLAFNNATDYTVGNKVISAGTITKEGAGKLTIANAAIANEFSGSYLNVAEGTLDIQYWRNAKAIGGATIAANAVLAVGGSTSANTFTNGAITGQGAVSITGGVRFNALCDYDGVTTVNANSELTLGALSAKGGIKNNLFLDGGSVANNVSVAAWGSGGAEYAGSTSGVGIYKKIGDGTLRVTGNFGHTGGTQVYGHLIMDTASSMLFDINSPSLFTAVTKGTVSNPTTGCYLELDGELRFDVGGISGLQSGEWEVISKDLTSISYGLRGITLIGENSPVFTEDASGSTHVWTGANGNRVWRFTEGAAGYGGVLSLSTVPEPGTLGMIATALASIAVFIWRRRS